MLRPRLTLRPTILTGGETTLGGASVSDFRRTPGLVLVMVLDSVLEFMLKRVVVVNVTVRHRMGCSCRFRVLT